MHYAAFVLLFWCIIFPILSENGGKQIDKTLIVALVSCALTVAATFLADILKSSKDRACLQKEHDTLRGDHSTLREDHSTLREDNKALQSVLEKAEGRITELHKEEREELRKLTDAAIRAENAQRRMDEAQDRAVENGVDVREMLYGIQGLAEKNAELSQTVSDLRAGTVQRDALISNLQDQVHSAKQELIIAKKQSAQYASVIQKQRQEIRRLESRLRGRQPGRDEPEWER